MSSLTVFNYDGLELIINSETGECFASFSGAGRMTDKQHTTIMRYANKKVDSGAWEPLKTAEINTATGFRTCALLNENQLLEVVAQYKPELLLAFTKAGLRVYLHELAGFKVTSEAVQSIEPVIAKLPPMSIEAQLEVADKIQELSTDFALVQPRLAQILADHFLNQLLEQKRLPDNNTPVLRGIVEIAQDVGYKQAADLSVRSRLGKFVANRHRLEIVREQRLCNGRMTEINCYPDTEAVRGSIRLFFEN